MERLNGSKPTLPMMPSSSKTAGCSMNGMEGEAFIEIREGGAERVLHTRAPERAVENVVMVGATKADMVDGVAWGRTKRMMLVGKTSKDSGLEMRWMERLEDFMYVAVLAKFIRIGRVGNENVCAW